MELMQQFERGMGLTLKNAWLHAEAVQVRPDLLLGTALRCVTLNCLPVCLALVIAPDDRHSAPD